MDHFSTLPFILEGQMSHIKTLNGNQKKERLYTTNQ